MESIEILRKIFDFKTTILINYGKSTMNKLENKVKNKQFNNLREYYLTLMIEAQHII